MVRNRGRNSRRQGPTALALIISALAACAAPAPPPPKLEQAPIDSAPLRLEPAQEPARGERDAGAPADPHHVELTVGQIKTLGAKDVRSFSVANANVDVRLGPDHTFIIAGKAKGRCDLLLIRRDGSQETYTIEVFAP